MDCWLHEIERSRTETEVVENARDFLALWSPRELEPITLGWRDLRIETAADIERMKRWTVDELGARLCFAQGARELVALRDYFWRAAERIAEIRQARRDPSMIPRSIVAIATP